jgi:hypothetical protein
VVEDGYVTVALFGKTLHAHSLDEGLQIYRLIPRFAGFLHATPNPLELDCERWLMEQMRELSLVPGSLEDAAHHVLIDTVQKTVVYGGSPAVLRHVMPPDYPAPFLEILKQTCADLEHKGYRIEHVRPWPAKHLNTSQI